MTTTEILEAARAKIEKPENWTKGVPARDAKQREVDTRDAEACQFCAWGALEVVNQSAVFGLPIDLLIKAMGTARVGTFNDTHSHEEILAAFDRAIELSKQGVQL